MSEYTLEQFADFLKIDAYFCLNYKVNTIVSKNHFISNFTELSQFVNMYKNNDCYITYNRLASSESRKLTNIKYLRMIGLDIEATNKHKPEQLDTLRLIKYYVSQFIDILQVKTYALINSGNGYHLHIDLGKPIQVTQEVTRAYLLFIKQLDKMLLQISNNFVTCNDRKDINGILRIPYTRNTSANRTVKIEHIQISSSNTFVRQLFIKRLRKTRTALKKAHKISKVNVELNVDFYEHPLVKMWLDESLPDDVGKHNTIGFALQALVKNYDLQNSTEIRDLQDTINTSNNSSLQLNSISKELDNLEILRISYVFAKEYMPKYCDEIRTLILQINSDN